MRDVDVMLAQLAKVPAPCSLGNDPGFIARLEAGRKHEELLGVARSIALAVSVAGLMVAIHPSPVGRGGGILLLTTSGEIL